jgi:hypothetical protein
VNPNLALQKATKRCRISGKQGNAQVKRKTTIRTNQNNDPLGDSVREPNGEIRLKMEAKHNLIRTIWLCREECVKAKKMTENSSVI